jgi:type 1 fimbria pilin
MIQKILFAAMLSGAAFSAQAQSAGFSITGTIAPSACTISLGGGGVNDFVSLSSESLTSATTTGDYASLSSQRMSVAVICPAPTKFALTFTDNREGTALGTSELGSDAHFGLGTYNGQKIGNARFYTGRLQIRTVAGGVLQTPATRLRTTGVAGPNSSWDTSLQNMAYYFLKNNSIAFAASADATGPDALTEVSGDVDVSLRLNKPVVDAATTAFQLDGSSTVTLILL